MITTRRVIAAITLLTVLGAVAISGSALAQSTSDEEIVFVAGTINDMRTVNPFRAFESPEFEVMDLNYDLLISFSQEDMSPVPNLATKWTPSEDGLTWTIELRDDVTWQDGEPFTANDVVFTFDFIAENNIAAFTNYLPFTDSFEVIDDYTFAWNTTEPTTAPEVPPYVYILPEHIWGEFDKKEALDFKNYPNMIGTGPFQLTDWDKGQSWTMEANPDYWGGAPLIDKYIVRKYDNEEAMVTALREGEIDYIGDVSIDLFDSLATVEGISTHVGPETAFTQMSFPMCQPDTPEADVDCKKTGTGGHPALLDHDVRLAIATAIDKQSLVDRVLQGFGSPGTVVLPPYMTRWRVEPEEPIPYDPVEANRILDEAGYLDTDNDGVREMPNGGQALDFRFVLRSEDPQSITSGEFISGWLDEIGISTKVDVVTDDKLTDIYLSNDFDLYIWGWGVEPDPGFQLSTYTTEECGYWSDTCYANPEYDQLYEEQQTVASSEERAAIVAEMQQIVYSDIPEIVLYNYNSLEAYDSAEWGGLEENVAPNPDGFLWGQYGRHTALTVAPLALIGEGGTGTKTGDSGISAGVWLAILAGVVAVILVVTLVRRGRSDEDRA
ncbi:MAG: ABC transporter substrate-binding protein [Actinomycetota bacterium]